ncbi:hypothetical protein [uncultured Methanobrevibacter sp.]|uniref:hypothetical protein n=1 Tax=uncultured Methanobrevibacter sp. TaxID=253161 RepID=UPI0025DD906D|nr:hypothetical protein [uncultured Methanobrevibacter sp.]
MSKYSLFLCDNCDFQYEHVDRVFYFNEDLTEISEDSLRIMTSRAKTASLISGFILVWYCRECKEFVTEYDITDNKSNLKLSEVYDLIKKVSSHNNILIYSEITDNQNLKEANNEYRYCSKCGSSIDSIWNFTNCPYCDKGQLHLVDKYIFD